MKTFNLRGALHPQLRRFLTLSCAAALFVAYEAPLDHRGDGVGHVPFLEFDAQVVVQRRKPETSPADVLLSGLLEGALPLAALGGWADLDPRYVVLLLAGYLHLYVFPSARRQAFAAADTFDELHETFAQINRLYVWMVALGTLLLLAPNPALPRGGYGLPMLLGSVAPQSLRPGNLTSTTRDGIVDLYRVRTAHTDTHWVIEINQSITLRIPRSDPDLADLVMVLLHLSTGPDGRPYLDQATIGKLFRLSRQMTNKRFALYKRRELIADVLSRERHNHALTEPVVNAIHQLLLADPFIGPTAARQRLVEQGLLAKAEDISLTSVTQAMRTVDYLKIRERIQELMHKGDLVADHEKLSRLLLQEMSQMAAAAGKKIGQHILTAVQIAGLLQVPSVPLAPASSAEKPMRPKETPLLPDPGAANSRVPLAWREVFHQYFSFGASYQEVASAHGVWASTIYRRLVVIHSRLPSLQAVLGEVLYSGIVCVDEKYILAPKESRARKGKMARWVYLFVAIDPYTYDLLHAEVYPDRTADCARAFLLGLKAKGVLTPQVIVTDLWRPYETVVPEVYPGATHHQCVFHAEQAVSDLMKDKLGSEYRTVPEAMALHKAIVHLFRAGCRRTLLRRYQKLLQLREPMLTRRPELVAVFDSVARHFERVANAYNDRRIEIPRTNNAVERVIRCFTRRYKTMAGFETLKTARAYVRLWSYYYRFRPFSPDANPGIRRRSPLEIAGYDVQGLECLDLVMPPPQVESAPRA